LDTNWQDQSSLLYSLPQLQQQYETAAASVSSSSSSSSSRTSLATLLSNAVLTLLRKESNWSAVSLSGESWSRENNKAETVFQKYVISERAKFEKETVSTRATTSSSSTTTAGATQMIVSLVIAIRGQSDIWNILRSNNNNNNNNNNNKIPFINAAASTSPGKITNSNELKNVLQTLASEALSDEGENILAVEILWTPSEYGNILPQNEVIMNYPELLKL
jgi:uncharacterized membrane protein